MTSPSDQIVEVMAEGIRAQGVISTLSAYAVANIALSALKQAGLEVLNRGQVAQAWYDGFVKAKSLGDWPDMYDWAALEGQDYAKRAMLQAHEEEQGSSRITQDRSASGRGSHAITDAERVEDWKTKPQSDLEKAIAEFKAALPGWWYSIGECQVSCDASCAPTVESRDIGRAEHSNPFDGGFHADLAQPSTLAEALRDVMTQALTALAIPDGGEAVHSQVEGESSRDDH